MLRLLLAPIAAITMLGGDSDRPALKLKVGDAVTISGPYGGDFTIQHDGAIYGRGFGRLVLEGKTWSEGQNLARKALKPFVLESDVFLTIRHIRQEVVYLVGTSGRGPIDLAPNLSLRQVLASAEIDEDADLMEAQLFRGGSKVRTVNVGLFLSANAAEDVPLEPNDVITLAPTGFVRVWVTGLVMKSGQLKVPAGTDAYKAIAQAGGVPVGGETQQDELKIVVRRGPEVLEFPIRQSAGSMPMPLEPGDTVTVVAPETTRITVAGEVERPGEVVVRGDHSLVGAIALAGGKTAEGTLDRVMVMRKGQAFQVDVSGRLTGQNAPVFSVQAGDLVYVQRNERIFQVLGEVARPGKVVMEDQRAYRLSDALAQAGGLTSKGTLRRVYLARADSTGKVQVQQFHLDEFLKDGRIESNPELRPGDCILFTTPKCLTISAATQILSVAAVFGTVTGG